MSNALPNLSIGHGEESRVNLLEENAKLPEA
jgi:hypothetical protein